MPVRLPKILNKQAEGQNGCNYLPSIVQSPKNSEMLTPGDVNAFSVGHGALSPSNQHAAGTLSY